MWFYNSYKTSFFKRSYFCSYRPESGITFSLSKFYLLSFLSIAAIILAKLLFKCVISCLLYNGIKRCKEWENKKKNDVKNTPLEIIRNEQNSVTKKPRNSKMPTAVLRGDSQSGLAANASIRSALSWPFYLSWSDYVWRVLDRGTLLCACICQAPVRVPKYVAKYNTNCFWEVVCFRQSLFNINYKEIKQWLS